MHPNTGILPVKISYKAFTLAPVINLCLVEAEMEIIMRKYKSIRQNLFVSITTAIMSVLLVSTLITYFYFRSILIQQLMADQENIIKQSAANLENIVNELDRVILYLTGDRMIPQILEESPSDLINTLNFPMELKERFSVYTNFPLTANYIDCYSTLYVSEQYPLTHKLASKNLEYSFGNVTSVYNSKAVKDEDWYTETVRLAGKTNCFVLDGSPGIINFSKLLRNVNFRLPDHDDTVGVVVMGLREGSISKILNSAKATDNTMVMWVWQDEILASNQPDKSGNGKLSEEYAFISDLRPDSRFQKLTIDQESFLSIKLAMTWGLELVAVIPEADITGKLADMITLLLIEAALAILLGTFFSNMLSNKFSKPIIQLARQMKDESVQIIENVEINDEIGILYHNYYRMLERIQEQIAEIEHTSELKKEMELRALKAQINPHFIYNTLDSINWIALCENQDDISTMVTALTEILRYSIRTPGDMVTLKEELENLSKYLQIQYLRYRDQFAFNADIPGEYENVLLPQITLQPLVENALFHASNRGRHIDITLRARASGKMLMLVVSDNGESARAEQINCYLNGEESLNAKGEGIGIRNVNSRIKMHFGEQYGLHYEEENGLAAVITLPLNYSAG